MSVLVLVVDDEPDVEALFRQQFRRDLRAERFIMDFASSAPDALARVGEEREEERCHHRAAVVGVGVERLEGRRPRPAR